MQRAAPFVTSPPAAGCASDSVLWSLPFPEGTSRPTSQRRCGRLWTVPAGHRTPQTARSAPARVALVPPRRDGAPPWVCDCCHRLGLHTAIKKYRSEGKGRRSFDTALHCNTVDMIETEEPRIAKAAVRATCSFWSGTGILPVLFHGQDGRPHQTKTASSADHRFCGPRLFSWHTEGVSAR